MYINTAQRKRYNAITYMSRFDAAFSQLPQQLVMLFGREALGPGNNAALMITLGERLDEKAIRLIASTMRRIIRGVMREQNSHVKPIMTYAPASALLPVSSVAEAVVRASVVRACRMRPPLTRTGPCGGAEHQQPA